jgi:methionine sulfoxide reductase heme-binding subunit
MTLPLASLRVLAGGPLVRGLLTNAPPLSALPGGHPHAVPVGGVVIMPSSPLWYTTRATGLVALVLLTISMVLGLLSSVGYQRPELPRFVTAGLHRNASLLALAFTAVHVVTTVADSYVSIPVQDAFIPFIGSYRPLWLGLGAIASDLLLALIVTSLVRARMSYRSWRLVHWTSYACWPVAVLHGLGTGSDTRVRWVLLLTLACTAAVVGGVGWRLAAGWPAHRAARLAGAAALVVALVAGGAWLAAGPLRAGWASRAGTPPDLIHHTAVYHYLTPLGGPP